jgi:para-nitrobenzyl esterase
MILPRLPLSASLAIASLAACAPDPATSTRQPEAIADEASVDDDVTEEPLSCELGAQPSPLAVPTRAGWLEGKKDDGVHAFKGIPYALPPTGERRLAPPEDLRCFHGAQQANDFGPTCVQPRLLNIAGSVLAEQSEDCLTLNVWSETLEQSARRPVMVFIHGGANILGSAADLLPYDGASWVKDFGVVFVTLQYRLGALGFLAHEDLAAERAQQGDVSASGNLAHLDQVKALEWVRDNIAAFGGDPDNVMLFGESAGAFNTCMLLASPLARGLFHSALIESGECALIGREEAQARGAAFASAQGCEGDDAIACLRALPASAFEGEITLDPTALGGPRGWKDLPWVPNLDGHVFTQEPLEAFRDGAHNDVPVVIGSNAHETELFTPADVITCGQVEDTARDLLGDAADAVLADYPCDDFALPRHAFVAASTDFMFRCPARRIARALSEGGTSPVWRYAYDHIRTDPLLAGMRAFHASELMLLFGSYDRVGMIPTQGEDRLARAMRAAWSDLAVHHDPGVTRGGWPLYDAARDNMLVLDAGLWDAELSERVNLEDALCDQWDALASP